MPHPSAATWRRPPALLLPGLLALLLWGQCARMLSGAATPTPALRGQVVRTDSLSEAAGFLSLTLRLHNTLPAPVTVQEVSGSLRFGNKRLPFSATAALRGRQLLVFEHLTERVAISLPPDDASLAALRTALSPGHLAASARPVLRWQVRYTQPGLRGTRLRHISSYLPGLPHRQAYPPQKSGPAK